DERALAGRVLTAADLDLSVGGRVIEGFDLDRICGEAPAPPADEATGPPPSPAVPLPRPIYVFFFDQTHLTMAGRARAIELGGELIEKLVVDGARASIISSAAAAQTVVPPTSDVPRLLAGLKTMRDDPRAFDAYAMTEGSRIDDVLSSIDALGLACVAKARWYAREERSFVLRTKDRLIHTFATIAEVPPPKAVVYFGDTLRQKAGLHYFHLPCNFEDKEVTSSEMIPSAASEFDAIVEAATARGVHLFTVEAQGMTSVTPHGTELERVNHAEDTLVGLAAETGGEAYIRGVRAERIASGIQARMSCPYLVSFDPGDLPKDRPLAVTLVSKIHGVSMRVPSRIVIPSESELLAARLTAAFVAPTPGVNRGLHIGLVPRGVEGGRWKASVQIRYDSSVPHRIGVDLGASVIQKGTVVAELSRSIATSGKPRPLVLDGNVSFSPGPVRVVAVVHDPESDDIVSADVEAEWPALNTEAVIAPIALLQGRAAAVARIDLSTLNTPIAVGPEEALDPSLWTTMQSIVCRGSAKGPLIVDRVVAGASGADFTPMKIEPDGEPCIQTLDVLKPGAMNAPMTEYRVIVRTQDRILADQKRDLRFSR
ncbi:MAG TPA: hypothetical protein VFB67_09175, partial [Candidatus Polarisedimenticolaceae bacterium]|nr:hypothetical protein [Candidatus Polarisedimenticolaceae bacterium]